MGNPYAFGHRSIETYRLQQRLIEKGFDLSPDGADYIYGTKTKAAVTAIQHQLGVVATGQPDKAVLVYLGLVAADQPSIFDQLGTLLSLVQLLKGQTMTTDQITGVIRTLLAAIAAYLAGKGYIPGVSPELLTAITTVIVGVWSLYSNRAKTIIPLADKFAK